MICTSDSAFIKYVGWMGSTRVQPSALVVLTSKVTKYSSMNKTFVSMARVLAYVLLALFNRGLGGDGVCNCFFFVPQDLGMPPSILKLPQHRPLPAPGAGSTTTRARPPRPRPAASASVPPPRELLPVPPPPPPACNPPASSLAVRGGGGGVFSQGEPKTPTLPVFSKKKHLELPRQAVAVLTLIAVFTVISPSVLAAIGRSLLIPAAASPLVLR